MVRTIIHRYSSPVRCKILSRQLAHVNLLPSSHKTIPVIIKDWVVTAGAAEMRETETRKEQQWDLILPITDTKHPWHSNIQSSQSHNLLGLTDTHITPSSQYLQCYRSQDSPPTVAQKPDMSISSPRRGWTAAGNLPADTEQGPRGLSYLTSCNISANYS